MRWEQWHGFLLLAFLLAFFCLRDASPQEQALRESYLSIRDKLTSLKSESELVTEQLTQLSESLTASQKEAAEWEAQSTTLSESLTSINEQLNDYLLTIEKQDAKLKTSRKVIAACGLLMIAISLLKILAYALYLKGIKLPRWLDILL